LYKDSRIWLLKLIQDTVHGEKHGVDTQISALKRRDNSVRQCENIVSVLLELLITIEENSDYGGNPLLKTAADSAKVARMSPNISTRADMVIAIIETLSIFCKAYPPLLSQHILTLLPYLKCDNKLSREQEAIVSYEISDMLVSIIPLSTFSLGSRSSFY
jgi:hypothetical protein